MPTTLGQETKTTIHNLESHKLMLEFVAAAAIHLGQPVFLDPATGQIKPVVAATPAHQIIGISVMEKANVGDVVTVAMRGYTHLRVGAAAAINAGPVKWSGYDATNKVNQYVAATDGTDFQGWCLTKTSGASTEVFVVLW